MSPHKKILDNLKTRIKPHPKLYRILLLLYGIIAEMVFFLHSLTSGKLFAKHDRRKFNSLLSKQKVLSFQIFLPDFHSVDGFRNCLTNCMLDFKEGGWTFYLPPQKDLDKYFPFISARYPQGSGIKILKDFKPPHRVKYTNHKQNPAPGAVLKRHLTPSPEDLLRVANYLYSHQLGVRVYDLIGLNTSSLSMTAFVVQHVNGRKSDHEDYNLFVNDLNRVMNLGNLETSHDRNNQIRDLIPPDCSGNLLIDIRTGRPLYVDFQTFYLKDEKQLVEKIARNITDHLHFGGKRLYRGRSKYLYQEIPGLTAGKRDTERRWQIFSEMMKESGITFDDKVIFDIGCNAGLMLHSALSDGAFWAVGWDKPEVVSAAKKLLLALGASRFDLIGEEINEKTNFKARLSDHLNRKCDAILFYLAVSNHIGFPPGIANLPWNYMFYEGHSGQNIKDTIYKFKRVPWLNDIKVLNSRTFFDGDSPRRTIVILER